MPTFNQLVRNGRQQATYKSTAPALQKGLTLSPNEVYKLDPLVYPALSWNELLEFTSSKPSVVRVVNNKLVAANSGRAIIRVSDPTSGLKYTFPVTVLKEGDEGYRRYDKPVANNFNLYGYYTNKALLLAVESRTSSPVRIPRDKETLQHVSLPGIYPCGEGAGYAGGIVSSAMDGINCAVKIFSGE